MKYRATRQHRSVQRALRTHALVFSTSFLLLACDTDVSEAVEAESQTQPLCTVESRACWEAHGKKDAPDDEEAGTHGHQPKRPAKQPPESESPALDPGQPLGEFFLTYYWVVFAEDFPGPAAVPLYAGDGTVLATVSDGFAQAVTMEGTGVLPDGRMLNLLTECQFAQYGWCFFEIDRDAMPYGAGAYAPLHPYRSLAVSGSDTALAGSILYIPELDGLSFTADSGPVVHDGCVAVVDNGWSFGAGSVDLFVWTHASYEETDQALGTDQITLYAESPLCPDSIDSLYAL